MGPEGKIMSRIRYVNSCCYENRFDSVTNDFGRESYCASKKRNLVVSGISSNVRSTKKRKFSPQVRISSKNQRLSTISSRQKLLCRSQDISVSDAVTCTPDEDDDQELDVKERKLSQSKWASPRTASSPEPRELKQQQEGNEVSDNSSCVDKYRNVSEYERLMKISEGSYGVVYKARDKKNGEIVALKKLKMGNKRDVMALREMDFLKCFQHQSVVKMKEVALDDLNGSIYMVMEYIDHELRGYMEHRTQRFTQSEVKYLMIQLLDGLSYIHDNNVIHRDLKTSNLLLNKKGELKICDFGMSRRYVGPTEVYSPLVVTLWYRAPELLLGMKNYTTAIDMWSVGCIMAELLSKKPLFDGNGEIEQIEKIFRTLGTPNDLIWPGCSKLPGVKFNFVKQQYNYTLRKIFPAATFTGSPTLTQLGFDLLNKFLTYDPNKRISAKEACNHGWFCEAPLPAQHIRIINL